MALHVSHLVSQSVKQLLTVMSIAVWASPALAAPPSALFGKTVKLTWQESWQRRAVSDGTLSTSNFTQNLTFYISEKGRVFTRRENVFRRGTAAVTSVGDDVQRHNTSGMRSFSTPAFSGTQLVATRATTGGTATRLTVNFDASFESCTATVQHGSSGARSVVRGTLNGNKYEVLGTSATTPSCSVVSGNLLN